MKVSSFINICNWFQSLAAADWEDNKPNAQCVSVTVNRTRFVELVLWAEEGRCENWCRLGAGGRGRGAHQRGVFTSTWTGDFYSVCVCWVVQLGEEYRVQCWVLKWVFVTHQSAEWKKIIWPLEWALTWTSVKGITRVKQGQGWNLSY